VLRPGGGAAAVWAPAGLASNADSAALDEFFFAAAMRTRGARLGDALLEAYRSFAGARDARYLLDIYNLQGDPALRLW
jgi:hypothetical protein